jgi:Cytochrome c554 and c-prime
LSKGPLPLAILFVGIAVVGFTSADQPERSKPASSTRYTFPQAKVKGNLSCASASCHAAGDEGKPGSEYSTWVNSDPHYRAFDVLFNAKSQSIAKTLDARGPNGKLIAANENESCLHCHSPETDSAENPHASHGVGCESCHGAAEKWLTTHYQDSFKSLSREEKAEKFGLYPTKDLAFRVSQCASCHVGDATREVNHDLIAAGHPRLAFEYTGYHRSPKYVPHWRETAYGPDFEARAWQIGQIACARAAVGLLQARATSEKGPWPELSEYSCFACHKDLTNEKWKPVVSSSRTPGAMPWGTWYFSTLDLAAGEASLAGEVQQLVRAMESSGRNRALIVTEAARLNSRLDRRLAALQRSADEGSRSDHFDGQHMRGAFVLAADHALLDNGSRLRDVDWDGATQHYLAAAALYYAWASVDSEHRDPRFLEPLKELGRRLAFPKGYNSPKDVEPVKILSLFRRLRTTNSDPFEIR